MSDQGEAIRNREQFKLLNLAENLWKQKLLIAAVSSIFMLFGLVYAYTATSEYESTATLLPPREGDIVPFNLGREVAGLPEFDAEGIYSLFKQNLMDGTSRDWFYREHYRPAMQADGAEVSREALMGRLRRDLTVRRPDPRGRPEAYEVIVSHQDPEKAAAWADAYVDHVAHRTLDQIKRMTVNQLASRNKELQDQMEVLRSLARLSREHRMARLKEALRVAEAVGLQTPQVAAGRIAAAGELAIHFDAEQLYSLGARALRSELEVLQDREVEDPFIPDLEDLQREAALLNVVNVEAEGGAVFTLDSAPVVADSPARPQRLMIVLLSLALGGMLGTAIALVRIAWIARRRSARTDA